MITAEQLYEHVKKIESRKYTELVVITAIVFTSLLLFFTSYEYRTFADALFTFTQGPVIYTLSYYFRKKNIEHEVVGIIFTYLLALAFYTVITGVIDFRTTFIALIIFIIIRKLSYALIDYYEGELSPAVIIVFGFLVSLVAFLLFNIFFAIF